MPPRGAAKSLTTYKAKRRFDVTSEPSGEAEAAPGRRYTIQKHDATRLHYDLRLELDGVLKSWAVTRGPSLDPADKRLAVRTEDHPLDYADFEGTIPRGQYGGGTVMLWDEGSWAPIGDAHRGLKDGMLKFRVSGRRLRGRWVLIRMKPREKETRENWLLIKEKDREVDRERDVLAEAVTSVKTGRTLDEIAAGAKPKRQAPNGAPAKARKTAGRTQPMPRFIAPQLATLVDAVPDGEDWLYEVKFDGYRALLSSSGGEARVFTRSGLDWTDRFGPIAEAAAALRLDGALIDGEVVVVDAEGRTDFSALQQAMKGGGDLSYFAFDCLRLGGEDLRGLPLTERKERLRRALAGAPRSGPIYYTDHLDGGGAGMLAEMCRHGFEGVIAKRADAPYRSRRTLSWLKIKCGKEREFVIGGYRPSDKARAFSSLLVGEWEGERLVYRGRVGTGYDAATLADLSKRFARLGRKTSPFDEVPRDVARQARWLRPDLVAQISYAALTGDGYLRHARYVGLREDKPAQEVQPEKIVPVKAATSAAKEAVTVAGVRLTHPERILFPKQGLTKRDLALYLEAAAGRMLPYLARRPVSLVRCPEGRAKACFFQRHASAGMPKAFRSVPIAEKDGAQADYLVIDDVAGLVSAAQIGVLELHVWGATEAKIEAPERIVFDLDPDDSVPFATVRDAARSLRDALDALSLESFALVTGGKGVHVVVPVQKRHDWATVKGFARALAERFAENDPDAFVATMSKARRKGRIFIDHFRNERGATAIAPYSPRARERAPVACPVAWDELAALPSANAFTLPAMAARLSEKDPWAGYAGVRQSLRKPALAALGL